MVITTLIFLLNRFLEKHIEEYGFYNAISQHVVQFILLDVIVVTGDYGVFLEIMFIVYEAITDDTTFG